MQLTIVHGIAAGALVTGAIVAFVVRPAALSPRPPATPFVESVPAEAPVARSTRVPVAPRAAVVYVAGAVVHPGVYAVASDARALDAVAKAGGMTRDADAAGVNLAAHVVDGDEIAVPRAGESLPARSRSSSDAHARTGKHARRGRHHRRSDSATSTAGDATDAPAQRIDLNTADASTLATVPGIGETLAARIVEFRAVNGPFASVDALADVSGITPSRFDAIASFLTVGQP